MLDVIYLNGEYIEKSEAKVSVFDRGFLFADGVYEVIPRFNGSYLGFDEHCERLKRSIREIHMQEFDLDIRKISQELILKNNIQKENCGLYVQVTRGTGQNRDHSYLSQKLSPTVFVMFQPVDLKDKSEVAAGFSAITSEDLRWSRCDIKSIALLPNIMAKSDAAKRGALEVSFHKEGKVTEGSASNLFIVKGSKLITPKANNDILGGITRKMILDICNRENIAFEERNIKTKELYDADELWVTSSTKLVAPIVSLDNKKISDGQSGKMWSLLFDLMLKELN